MVVRIENDIVRDVPRKDNYSYATAVSIYVGLALVRKEAAASLVPSPLHAKRGRGLV